MAFTLLFSMLLALGVVVFFLAFRHIWGARDPVDGRLKQYGVTGEMPAETTSDAGMSPKTWPVTTRLLNGFAVGPRLAADLMRADVSLTAAEFALLSLGIGLAGFLAGGLLGGFLVGMGLGLLLTMAPVMLVRSKGRRRAQQLTDQLPEVLTLLVGALRAGYGLPQALMMLVEQLPAPVSVELGRVMRAISLGTPVPRAMTQMADRIGSDDLDLMVTAISIQHELGGNLAQTLDTIGSTVRERIFLKREIRSLTAQQRLTGYILAALPLLMAVGFSILSPGYLRPLFEPGLRVLPATALALQIVGFLVISKIVDIEV